MSNIHMYDVSKTDTSYLIFRCVQVQPHRPGFCDVQPQHLSEDDDLPGIIMRMLNVQNRYVGIIENGSWPAQLVP